MASEAIAEIDDSGMGATRRAILAEVQTGNDLTFRQLSIVLVVYTTAEPQTVSGLAQALSVSKPVVTRAFDRLEALKLTRRRHNPRDGRSIIAQLTPEGATMMNRLKASLAAAVGEAAFPSR
jgi:DNA-binding MarR family transcriptional regulator